MSDKIIKCQIYEFDGTPSGFKLMIKRMYPNDNSKHHGYFDSQKRIAYIDDTQMYYKKGDYYQIVCKD